jgi:predicted enzyme related to lactoylglutathione lyase
VTAIDEFLAERIAANGTPGKGAGMPPVVQHRPVQLRIPVRDVAVAAAFYTAAFDVVYRESIASLQFGTYRSDRFFLLTLVSDGPGPAHFGLLVADVDRAHERALAAGGVEAHPPTDYAWKPRTSCVRDPDGNRIDLSQS